MTLYPGIITGGGVTVPALHSMLLALGVDDHPQYAFRVDLAELLDDLAQLDPFVQYQLRSGSGVEFPPLVDGVIPSQYVPIQPLADTFPVADLAELITVPANKGDLAVVTDADPIVANNGPGTFILREEPPTILGNWTLLPSAASVLTVDDLDGIVVLPTDAVAGVGSKRTLGPGPEQAAPGDHDHDDRYTPTPAESLGGSPHGLLFIGHSYLADLLVDGSRANSSVTGTKPQQHWPQILCDIYGIPDNTIEILIPSAVGWGEAINDDLQWGLFAIPFYGSMHNAYYYPLSAVTGGVTNSRSLYVANPGWVFGQTFAQLDLNAANAAHSLVASVPNKIPRTTTVGPDLLMKDMLVNWLSVHIGGGRSDGGGGVLQVYVNGGPKSNYGRSGSTVGSSDHNYGGWGEIDQHMTFRALAGASTATAVQTNSEGKIDSSLQRMGLPIFCHGLNDLTAHMDETITKESLRHMLAATRWMVRYIAADIAAFTATPSITQNAGSGSGAAWTFLATAPYWQYLGQREYFSGVPSANSYLQYAVPVDYGGEPIDLCYTSEPARTETITVTAFGSFLATISPPIPNFSSDDVGRPIAWAGSPTDMSVISASSVGVPTGSVTTGTKTAVVGRGGGTATITIDGAAPNFAGGVRINEGTSDQVNTDQVTPAFGIGILLKGVDQMHAIPITKRITGLSPGAHTIRTKIDTMAIGPSRFYSNGWAREAPDVPTIFMDTPAAPLLSAGQRADCITFNGWSAAVCAEFDDIYPLSLYDRMSPGGVPTASMFGDGLHPSFKASRLVASWIDEIVQDTPTRLLLST